MAWVEMELRPAPVARTGLEELAPDDAVEDEATDERDADDGDQAEGGVEDLADGRGVLRAVAFALAGAAFGGSHFALRRQSNLLGVGTF